MSVLWKWTATMRICFSDYVTYRLNFFLEFLGPALIFYFVKYNVWNAIYQSNGSDSLNGYTFQEMIVYQSWILAVVLLSQTYRGVALALDIRHGRISSFLLYPFHLWQYHASRCLSFFMLQSIIVVFTFLFLILCGIVPVPSLVMCVKGYLLTFFVAAFWFSYVYIAGLLAFWFEETWVFRVAMMLLTDFFSGSLIPLDFFPMWARDVLTYTPFPYLAYFPVQVLMGRVSDVFEGVLALGIWTAVGAAVAYLVWSKGLKLYTAAGM